jgi:glycolate oxidase FAD binding subunit
MVTGAASIVRPADVAGVVDAVRAAATDSRTVAIQGAGTKAAWGGRLAAVDVVLATTALTGVVAHEPGDRVVTVRSGTPLRELQETLAASGQRLCVESGYADATIGGVLASGEAGPLRLRYGSGRDLLIGVEFVRADGVVARSGGRVVKNVAGYDLGRLLCGSYGTVGVITTATFRLHPLPAASAWVVATGVRKDAFLSPVGASAGGPSPGGASWPGPSPGGEWRPGQPGALTDGSDASRRAAIAVLADIATVAPSAVESNLGGPEDTGELAVLVEGSPAGVTARARAVQTLLARRLPGADVAVVTRPPTWWGRYPFAGGEVGLKLALPVSAVPAVLGTLHERFGPRLAVRGSLGSGVLYAGLPDDVDAGVLAAALAGTGGTCVVLTAPPSIRDGLDLWGEVAGLSLMRRLKAQFDPAGRFAAGRFVGGL